MLLQAGQCDKLFRYVDEQAFRYHNRKDVDGNKLSDADRSTVDGRIKELREALKGDDVNAINRAKDALIQASHKLAEEVYKNAAAKEQGSQQSATGSQQEKTEREEKNPGPKPDDVVDADFRAKE